MAEWPLAPVTTRFVRAQAREGEHAPTPSQQLGSDQVSRARMQWNGDLRRATTTSGDSHTHGLLLSAEALVSSHVEAETASTHLLASTASVLAASSPLLQSVVTQKSRRCRVRVACGMIHRRLISMAAMMGMRKGRPNARRRAEFVICPGTGPTAYKDTLRGARADLADDEHPCSPK